MAYRKKSVKRGGTGRNRRTSGRSRSGSKRSVGRGQTLRIVIEQPTAPFGGIGQVIRPKTAKF